MRQARRKAERVLGGPLDRNVAGSQRIMDKQLRTGDGSLPREGGRQIGSYLRLSWPTIPHSGSSIERATNRIIPAIAMTAAGSKRAIARRTVSWTSRS